MAAANDVGGTEAGADASDASGGVADSAVDGGLDCSFAGEPINPPSRIDTPRWAFLPWISKDISDGPDTYAFVDGFIERDIPVGTVVLDSPWATDYNTFVPNPTRYPDFPEMVADLRDRGVRTVLWTTQFVNAGSFDLESGGDIYPSPAPNFGEAQRCGFFIEDGRRFTWWKGIGGAVDFFNPDASAWWRAQQNALLDAGVAGWKLDFGDEYVTVDPIETFAGEVTKQQYSEAYYKDFYDYGIHRNGHEEFVTMVRAWDESYQYPGRFFARPEHAPVVWVGDNRRDWVGLSDALDHTFRSAKAGYVVIGSDLGGYLDRDDDDLQTMIPFDRTNFLRWLAVSALMPFMQLHGRANLTPWTLPDDPDPDQSVALYRFWSHLHAELVPFFHSLARQAYAGEAEPIIRPVGELAQWAGDYRYMLGEAFLVAPILDGSGIRDTELPSGRWYDWWTGEVVEGMTTVSRDYSGDLQKIPFFVKAGAIVPLEATSPVPGVTEGDFDEARTILVWPAASEVSEFELHTTDGGRTRISVELLPTHIAINSGFALHRTIFRILLPGNVTGVDLNVSPLAELSSQAELATGDGYMVDGSYLWVSVPPSEQNFFIIANYAP